MPSASAGSTKGEPERGPGLGRSGGAGSDPPAADSDAAAADVRGVPNPSSELLDMILSVIPDAAVVVDGDGQIVAANANAETLFGYEAGTMVGRALEVLVPERFRTRHRSNRSEYAAAPATRAMGTGLELSGRRSDGSEFPIDVSLSPVAGADRLLVVGAVRDISERMAAAADQARLAAIVQSSADGIITIGDDGLVLTWNAGAAKMFGYEDDAILGRHISVLVPEEESSWLEEQMARAMDGKPNAASDTRWLTASGDLLDVAFSVSRVQAPDGHGIGFSLFARDITERKAMESALLWRERWLESTAEVRLALLSGAGLTECLGLAAEHLRAALGPCQVVLALDPSANWEDLGVAHPADGPVVPVDGEQLRSMVRGRELAVYPDVRQAPLPAALAEVLDDHGGHVVVAPLRAPDASSGALVLSVLGGDPQPDARALVQGLADQLGLAVRLAQARARETHSLLADDRARIARDLHDHVIQSLFATGMRLQSALPMVADEQTAEAINSSIDELDATIARIRTAIFSLQSTRQQQASGLRAELLQLAASTTGQLGFEPELRFAGPVESLPGHLRPHLLAVAREALSNAARHAAATRVVVELRAEERSAVLTVSDNGVGLGTTTRRSGLDNLRSRARDLGGDMGLRSPDTGGTELRWSVPLARPGEHRSTA